MLQILLVEDEPSLQALMALNLRQEGYEVVACGSAEESFKVYIPGKFALAILDVMLPGMEGFELCERLKLKDADVKVLFVSARGETKDRVEGLKRGADDYLPKPFDLEEFLLRVKRLMDRHIEAHPEQVELGDMLIDFSAHCVRKSDGMIALTKREAMVLKLLVGKRGQTVNRNEILEMVWGDEGAPNPRMVDNTIVNLRKILDDEPKNPRFLQSVRGVGYRLEF
jgi:two-component system alkaline phosphatase synthesis response regulator PhoP